MSDVTRDKERPFFFGKVVLGDSGMTDRFGDATFVGLRLALPVRVYLTADTPPRVSLVFYTSGMETLAAWQRHSVRLGGHDLGRLDDATEDANERRVFSMRTEDLQELLKAGQPLTLEISVGVDDPGLADDFLLTKITAIGAVVMLGW